MDSTAFHSFIYEDVAMIHFCNKSRGIGVRVKEINQLKKKKIETKKKQNKTKKTMKQRNKKLEKKETPTPTRFVEYRFYPVACCLPHLRRRSVQELILDIFQHLGCLSQHHTLLLSQ